jgi:threonine/homoserine/homoserine lactone efflux protein
MTILTSLTVLIFVAAITPGPNNLAVLGAATHRGAGGASRAIAGVLLGSLALLALALAGADALFASQPRVRDGISLLGCGYLAWLGARMIAQSLRAPTRTDAITSSGIAQLVGLQFANPKAWTLVLTAVAVARGAMPPATAALTLTTLFLVVPGVCLAAWAWFGLRLMPRLERGASRRWFDRTMGVLLLAAALALLADMSRWSPLP